MVVLLLVAAVCRDTRVWRYALPIAAVGVLIAGYHTQLQAFPEQQTFCSLNNPCTIRYVWEFGFISLPLMDLIALLFVIHHGPGGPHADRRLRGVLMSNNTSRRRSA